MYYLYIYKFKSIKTRGRGKLGNGRTGPTDMHIKMTVMTWSNTISKKINEFINVNWEINEKLILQNGQNSARSKRATIFTEKEKKCLKSAILTKLKFSKYVIVFLALILRGGARTGMAS